MAPALPVKAWDRCIQLDMNAIIPDDTLSINEGGIAPLGRRTRSIYFQAGANAFARKHKFSLDKPVKDLPEKALNLFYMERRRCIRR